MEGRVCSEVCAGSEGVNCSEREATAITVNLTRDRTGGVFDASWRAPLDLSITEGPLTNVQADPGQLLARPSTRWFIRPVGHVILFGPRIVLNRLLNPNPLAADITAVDHDIMIYPANPLGAVRHPGL